MDEVTRALAEASRCVIRAKMEWVSHVPSCRKCGMAPERDRCGCCGRMPECKKRVKLESLINTALLRLYDALHAYEAVYGMAEATGGQAAGQGEEASGGN